MNQNDMHKAESRTNKKNKFENLFEVEVHMPD